MPGRLFVEEKSGLVEVTWQAAGQLRPEGGDAEAFESPLAAEDLEDLRRYLEDYLRAPYAVYEDRGKAIEGRLPAWGEALFASVFGAGREGGKAYQRAAGVDDWELWIASESPGFLSLPWELLRDPDRPTPLALGISGIHRTVGTPQAAVAAPSGEALRVLMVIARPFGHGGRCAPEAAVATRLLQEGAAAVVAMGYSVYAVAAAELMAAFYEALFAGEPVTRAVTAGRRQLHRQSLRPSPKGRLPLEDWIVPVHYARREVAFPGLRQEKERGALSLDAALETIRDREEAAARPVGDGIHVEGEIDAAEGRFFGRDREFQWLETALRTDRVALLHGVGGTGKTELAKAFARWLRDSGGLDNPGLVFFHSFEPGLPSFGLDGVVASVGLRIYGADFARLDPEPRVEAVLEALRRHRMLLVWDNFETVHSMPDPEGVTPPLDDEERDRMARFLAEVRRAARGGVVLTSRSPEPWLGEELRRHEVVGLDREDASEYAEALLAGRLKAMERRRERGFADLMDHLGGHPLSLRLVLPRLEEETPGELLAALQGEGAVDLGDAETEGRLESLDACIHYSFRHLTEEDQSRLPALTLFEGVADANVLGLLSKQEGAPARFRGIEKDRWKESLDRCAANGLLTALGLGMYRIHPALARYLRWVWAGEAGESLKAEKEAAVRATIEAHAGVGVWLHNQIQTGLADVALDLLEVERRTFGARPAAGPEDPPGGGGAP